MSESGFLEAKAKKRNSTGTRTRRPADSQTQSRNHHTSATRGQEERRTEKPQQIQIMNSLNQQYEEKVRPCIDLIDSLRSLGVERDLALPAIAVIGDQSSGKSSVLEALSGVALPRGHGIVTRCPLELKMKRTEQGEEWYGHISYQDTDIELTDPADVENSIRKAQVQITGNDIGISADLISLEIASPDVPDLTLIDLPGIARVATKGQPENIGEQIKDLIQKFIKKQETISLVVVPANVDIATTEALKMAQEVDPSGERTLGILTKPDLVDKGSEELMVNTVHNLTIPLKKGYMVVKCRGQKEITENVSVTEALKREDAFFRNHAYFQCLYDQGQASIPKLAEKLTLELVHHIQKSLPNLEKQINTKRVDIQVELDKYGRGPPTDPAQRNSFLIDKVTTFTISAINHSSGDKMMLDANVNMFSVLRKHFSAWRDIIETSGVSFNWKIEKNVVQYEQKFRGRELPGFINYRTFEEIVKEQIGQLEEPALLKLKEISEIVRKELFKVAEAAFVGFPKLILAAKMTIESVRKEKELKAESMVRTQFQMESLVYTQDSRYSKKLGKRKREEPIQPGFGSPGVDSQGTLREMVKHLKSYYKIASHRLADQIPLLIHYQMLQKCSRQLQREMMQMLQDREKIQFLLNEDGSIQTKRNHLRSRLDRLTKARVLLSDFSLNIFNFATPQLEAKADVSDI
ncbi:interferon-induced GTP-binding protein Mx-like isoform X2 [Nelusetta ayraudi]